MLRDIKTHNSFHKYRMKWKFISDPIFKNWMLILSCYVKMNVRDETRHDT